MRIEFRIDPDAGVIYVKVLGAIVVKEVEAVRAQWQSHPDFRTGLDMIYRIFIRLYDIYMVYR